MKRSSVAISFASLLTASLLLLQPAATHADWRQFRGPSGNGAAEGDPVPVQLDAEDHIAWKQALPGRGLSSPVVVGEKLFVTCSSGPDQNRLHIICHHAKTGERLWERQFYATGRTMCHSKTNVAAPSPASDGKHLVALFSSNDLFCLDLDGNLLWLRGLTHDYPNASNSLGMSSSPVIAGGVVVVQIENDSESFAAGLDLVNGMNLWKRDRPNQANWSSPVTFTSGDQEIVALQGSSGVEAIDPASGEVLWHYDKGASTIPSSAVHDQTLYVPSNGLTAIKGGPDGSAVQIWQESNLRPGTSSPLVWDNLVYVVNNSNVLNCALAESGKRLWRLRLEGPFESSPVAINGHLYIFNEKGTCQVVALGPQQGEIVATLELGEMIQGTPAISDGALFVRSDSHLWRIGDP